MSAIPSSSSPHTDRLFDPRHAERLLELFRRNGSAELNALTDKAAAAVLPGVLKSLLGEAAAAALRRAETIAAVPEPASKPKPQTAKEIEISPTERHDAQTAPETVALPRPAPARKTAVSKRPAKPAPASALRETAKATHVRARQTPLFTDRQPTGLSSAIAPRIITAPKKAKAKKDPSQIKPHSLLSTEQIRSSNETAAIKARNGHSSRAANKADTNALPPTRLIKGNGAQPLAKDNANEFGRAVETLIPNLRRYARSLTRDIGTADDIVQGCLARAIAKQHLFQEGTDLRAWLFTILHNQHVNRIRHAVREGTAVELSETEPVMTQQASQMKTLELRDLRVALNKLPEYQRTVILMVGLEGMSYEDVAKTLGLPVGTVRSRLSRGRDALRILMDREPAAGPFEEDRFNNARRLALARTAIAEREETRRNFPRLTDRRQKDPAP